MALNVSRLQGLINSGKFRKSDIIAASGISKGTLENVLKGMDPKFSTLEAIAAAVGVKVSYFLDEETEIDIRTAGRDYVERGDIIHNAAPASLTSSGAVPVAPGGAAHAGGCIGAAGADADALAALAAENADLRRRLIEAQSKIIALMESRL